MIDTAKEYFSRGFEDAREGFPPTLSDPDYCSGYEFFGVKSQADLSPEKDAQG